MSNVTPSSVPAGWYPDPAGTPRQRWWDGNAWTEHYNEAPVATQPYAGAQQPYAGAQQPYSYAATAESLKAPEGIPIYNIWIWLILALPVLSTTVSYATTDWGGIATTVGPTNGTLVLSAVGWVFYGLSVFFAYRDYKTLLALGVPRPFHWAWGFLSLVYVIGRSVVVRRRTGHGILPMWIAIAFMALTFVVTIVILVTVVSAAVSQVTGR
ncbi:MAG: DUF2510 domain-containing protein [Rhodoglobus sp.]